MLNSGSICVVIDTNRLVHPALSVPDVELFRLPRELRPVLRLRVHLGLEAPKYLPPSPIKRIEVEGMALFHRPDGRLMSHARQEVISHL